MEPFFLKHFKMLLLVSGTFESNVCNFLIHITLKTVCSEYSGNIQRMRFHNVSTAFLERVSVSWLCLCVGTVVWGDTKRLCWDVQWDHDHEVGERSASWEEYHFRTKIPKIKPKILWSLCDVRLKWFCSHCCCRGHAQTVRIDLNWVE